MTWAVIGGLIGLALVDSTSFGTLGVPVWMLAHPRPRVSRVLLLFATIGLFYFALGLLLLGGADRLTTWFAQADGSRTVDWVQLVVGVLMLVGSFWPDTPWAKKRAARMAEAAAESPTDGRRARWRERVTGPNATVGGVIGVAFVAGLIEAASMLPYLGAIALISTQAAPAAAKVGVLAAYVIVMLLPALGLLALRLALATRIEPVLARLDRWLSRAAGGAIWWIVGILGFFLAADGATRLGFFGG